MTITHHRLALVAALILVAVLTVTLRSRTTSSDSVAGADHGGQPGAGDVADLVADPTPAAHRASANPIAQDKKKAAQDASLSLRSFEPIYQDLVGLFLERQAAGPKAPDAHVAEFNAVASDLFAEMAAFGPEAGELSLLKVDGIPPPWEGELSLVERGINNLILDFALQQMTRGEGHSDLRQPLVRDMIDRLPLSPDYAGFITKRLDSQPYLDGTHELALMDLATIAHGDLAFLQDPVRRLLVTTWRNMGSSSLERADELLAYLDDPDAGLLQRAAMEYLLLSDEHRATVLSVLTKKGDHQLMVEMAHFAALHMDPDAAISVAAELKGASVYAHFGGAYMKLAERSHEELGSNYRTCLASNVQPGHREQSILALARYANGRADDIVREAFDHDPNPRVKGVALLAFGSQKGRGSDFQDCYRTAYADPNFHTRDTRYYLVNALSNHAPHGDREFLDAATSQLMEVASLTSQEMEKLERIRERYLN
jgi:hypothetical protein